MLTNRHIGLVLVVLMLPISSASAAPEVHVEYDPDFDFSTLETYAWKAGIPASTEDRQQRIVEAVDAALQANGLRLTEDGRPDVWVLTEAARDEQLHFSGASAGLTTPTSWGSVSIGTAGGDRVKELTVGTLTVAMLDAESGTLIWRANGSETLTENPDKTARTIKKGVAKAFKRFPLPPE